MIRGAIVALVASCYSQGGSVLHSIYGAYDARKFSSDPVATDLSGGKIGYQFRKTDSGLAGFVEAAHLSANDLGLTSLGVGGKMGRVVIRDRVEVGVLGFLEFQSASYERHQNSNQLFALGGVFGGSRGATCGAHAHVVCSRVHRHHCPNDLQRWLDISKHWSGNMFKPRRRRLLQ